MPQYTVVKHKTKYRHLTPCQYLLEWFLVFLQQNSVLDCMFRLTQIEKRLTALFERNICVQNILNQLIINHLKRVKVRVKIRCKPV
jgi:hypothetical protein